MKKLIFITFLASFALLLIGCAKIVPQNTLEKTSETVGTIPRPPAVSPKEVVEAYLKATLGTLPDANIDYEKAKIYLTEDLKSEFTTLEFVPLSYGIQQGPDKVTIESEDISGETAEVVVRGYWGSDNQMLWMFGLISKNNDWKISFINPGQ